MLSKRFELIAYKVKKGTEFLILFLKRIGYKATFYKR